MKVKIFWSGKRKEIEKEINEWLQSNDIRILQVCQSECTNDNVRNITITIIYN